MYGFEIVTLTKGGSGGGRAEDVKIFVESDQKDKISISDGQLRLSGLVTK